MQAVTIGASRASPGSSQVQIDMRRVSGLVYHQCSIVRVHARNMFLRHAASVRADLNNRKVQTNSTFQREGKITGGALMSHLDLTESGKEQRFTGRTDGDLLTSCEGNALCCGSLEKLRRQK